MTPSGVLAVDAVGEPRVGLVAFALVGLLGGAHCLGMCGPLVTLYADRMGEGDRLTWRTIRGHLLFNLGRTAAYAAVGALMGALGALLFDAAAVASVATDVRAVAGLVVGAFIVVTGLSYLATGRAGGHGHSLPLLDGAFRRAHAAITDRVDEWTEGPRVAALGTLHAALPCPLLYPAYLYALATGSPARGAVALGVLGLGTLPTLFLYGTAVGTLSTRSRTGLHRALGAAFVLLGYLPLAHGLMLFGVSVPYPSIPFYQPLG
ncbi:MAG: sulfite exporter TauE/SafE family protein [Haloferacaceae archaeon]